MIEFVLTSYYHWLKIMLFQNFDIIVLLKAINYLIFKIICDDKKLIVYLKSALKITLSIPQH